jgi:hypothetical protein
MIPATETYQHGVELGCAGNSKSLTLETMSCCTSAARLAANRLASVVRGGAVVEVVLRPARRDSRSCRTFSM